MRIWRTLAPATVETANAVGWSADALEARAFAFRGARSARLAADFSSHHRRRNAQRGAFDTALTRGRRNHYPFSDRN